MIRHSFYEQCKDFIETKIKKLENPLETYQRLIKIGRQNLPGEEHTMCWILDNANFLSKNFIYKDWTYEEIQKNREIFVNICLTYENPSMYRLAYQNIVNKFHAIGIDNLNDKQYDRYVEFCKILNFHITPRG